MYHHSRGDPLTTGEPPTPPLDNRLASDTQRPDFDPLLSRTTSDSDRPQSLTAQEQDSGYEASPCSVATNSCSDLHFFGSQPSTSNMPYEYLSGGRTLEDEPDMDDLSVTSEEMASSDDVFEECSSFVLLEREEDWCRDCSATPTCTCTCRPSSSGTVRSGTCDNNTSHSTDSSSPMRPSSLPIRIPDQHVSVVDSPVTNFPACSPPSDIRLQGSAVLSSPRSTSGFHLPRSWPLCVFPQMWNRPLPRFMAVPIETQSRLNRPVPRTSQGRRGLIDSEIDSDISTSDGEYSDSDSSVDSSSHPMGAMAEAASFPSRESPLEPLPDLILHSSPSVILRNRSHSVNLPLDPERIGYVGRGLRRLSDQFEEQREVPRNHCPPRRGTMDGTCNRPS